MCVCLLFPDLEFDEPQSFSFSKMHAFAGVESVEDRSYEGTPVKAPPCPERRMMTPMPQQHSFSSMEEVSPWSARERTATSRMEQYLNMSDCIKLGFAELEYCSNGLDYMDVDVRHILGSAKRRCKQSAM